MHARYGRTSEMRRNCSIQGDADAARRQRIHLSALYMGPLHVKYLYIRDTESSFLVIFFTDEKVRDDSGEKRS